MQIIVLIMYFTKPDDKYFDSVVNEVNKQFQSKSIELSENIRNQEIEKTKT